MPISSLNLAAPITNIVIALVIMEYLELLDDSTTRRKVERGKFLIQYGVLISIDLVYTYYKYLIGRSV